MRAIDNPQIPRLLSVAERDIASLQFPLPGEVFAFHAQQAIEKWMKALILARGVSHTFTHDLVKLQAQLHELGEVIPPTSMSLTSLTEYAVVTRYDSTPTFDETLRELLRADVERMHAFVLARLDALRQDAAS